MLRGLLNAAPGALASRCEICHAWPAAPVCRACMARFASRGARCASCALPIAGPAAHCGRCLRRPPPLDTCVAAVDYAYPWAGCIGAFKFAGQPGWCHALAELLLAATGAPRLLAQAHWVLPMPLSAGRLRERGFNQAVLLARRVAPGKLATDLLLRIRETAAQSSLDRTARQANVRGAFAVDPLRAASLAGRDVLLVDDVMTSGASLHEAALQLRRAGAASVSALVVARTDEP